MFPLDLCQNQRSTADWPWRKKQCLAQATRFVRVPGATNGIFKGLFVVCRNHTPSPNGQQISPLVLLPAFSRNGTVSVSQSAALPELERSRGVCRLNKSSEGKQQCRSEKQSSPLVHALASWPAATRLANRLSQAARLVPVQPSLQAAAWYKARPSARGRTWSPVRPNSLNANNLIAGPVTDRVGASPALRSPARQLLRRGFCISCKTKKDSPCSTRS